MLFVKLEELQTLRSPSFEQKKAASRVCVDKFMERIVVISCTNRPDSYTLKVCKAYVNLFRDLDKEAILLDFRELPIEQMFSEPYGKSTPLFTGLVHSYVQPHAKFVFVAPEYNGSYPGILKLFLDTVPPREWTHKKACLVGVSQGRAGNLRGMEHLTGVLQYLKMHVFYNKLPVSAVDKVVRDDGSFSSEEQGRACAEQVKGFLSF